jgi:hypothetical protein
MSLFSPRRRPLSVFAPLGGRNDAARLDARLPNARIATSYRSLGAGAPARKETAAQTTDN